MAPNWTSRTYAISSPSPVIVFEYWRQTLDTNVALSLESAATKDV
jgi:hypothetical protein